MTPQISFIGGFHVDDTTKLAAFNPIAEDMDRISLDIILDLSDDLFDDSGMFGDATNRVVSPTCATTSSARPNSPKRPRIHYSGVPDEKSAKVFQLLPEDVEVTCDPLSLPSASELVEMDLFYHRKRERENEVSTDDNPKDWSRFRDYQADQWLERFQELVEFRRKNGHCSVPHTFGENLPLARWVKRQRYQYKQFVEGGDKSSTMTEERIRALEEIGFVWNCQGSAWEERLNELREYKELFLDCNVPTHYPENPKLAMWVKCQRRQYKLFKAGQHSSITQERIKILEGLGFTWGLRTYSKTCSSERGAVSLSLMYK